MFDAGHPLSPAAPQSKCSSVRPSAFCQSYSPDGMLIAATWSPIPAAAKTRAISSS